MITLFYCRQRWEVAQTMRRLYLRQLTTASGGNVSMKRGKTIVITPSQIDKGRLHFRQVALMNINGQNLTPWLKLSMESEMHQKIYQTRPDIRAVVHAHPPFATAFTALPGLINPHLTGESCLVLGETGFAPYQTMGTAALAEEVAHVAKTSNVIFLQHHGVVALGKTLFEAFDRIEVIESLAKTTLTRKILRIEGALPIEEIEKIGNLLKPQ